MCFNHFKDVYKDRKHHMGEIVAIFQPTEATEWNLHILIDN